MTCARAHYPTKRKRFGLKTGILEVIKCVKLWPYYSNLCCCSCFYAHVLYHSMTFCSLPEVVSDVMSGIVVDDTGVDVCAKCGCSRSNRSERLYAVITDEDNILCRKH